MKGGFNLSRWALEHVALTRFLMIALLIGGVLGYTRLGQDEDPPFTFRVMVVRANWPGATALQMSAQVTDKLERKLQETPRIDKISSYSMAGESTIILQLAESVPPADVQATWYQVRKKVGDIRQTLPQGVLGPFFNDEFGDTYGTIYAISGDGFTYAQLREAAEFVRQRILRVASVAKVDFFGAQDEKLYIEFRADKFAQLGLTLDQVIGQINAQNAVQGSGVLVTRGENLSVQVSGALTGAAALEDFDLRVGSATFKLRDLARVTRGYREPPQDKMRFNGHEVIGLGVAMVKGGDVIELGRDLGALAGELRRALPVGMVLEQVADQPTAVAASVREFVRTLIEALVIVLAVSFVSLGLHMRPLRLDVRPGLVVGLTIPLVLAITFMLMDIFGINLHKISLGALIIALGLLVDDAIIAVEMMVRKMEEGLSRVEAASFAYTSTAMPMLTGTLITAAGFLPIGMAKSAAGEYTFSIFAVNAIALLVSWGVAVMFTPVIGYALLKAHAHAAGQHDVFDSAFYRGFRRLVEWCVTWRKTTIALTLATFLLGAWGFNFIQQQFFPDSSRLELMVEVWTPEGTSFKATEAATLQVEDYLRRQPEVASVTTYVGVGSPRFYLPLDQIFPHSNVSQMVVLTQSIPAREQLARHLTDAFRTNFPEVRGRVRLLPNGPPVPYPVQFRVSGGDVAKVRAYADQVKEVMRANPATTNVNDNWNESVKVVRIDLDQDKLRAVGASSQAVMAAANTALTGTVAGQFREANRLIDIVVRQPEDERNSVEALARTKVTTASGKQVPLAQLARIGLVWEPGVVWRENRELAITVQCDVVEGVQGPTVTAQLDPQLDKIRATLPPGYAIAVAGTAADSAKAQRSITVNLPLVIFLILTLLMVQLQSFTRTTLVFLTGPLGITGAAAALLLLQRPFGFVAQLGVIALFGMIIRNSVILIDQIEQDVRQGVPVWTAIIEAAVRRCRPIVLTAAAAVLAMIPLSRSVFWGPMAVAIMGGLIIATVLTLLFLPALYAAWLRVKPVPVTVAVPH